MKIDKWVLKKWVAYNLMVMAWCILLLPTISSLDEKARAFFTFLTAIVISFFNIFEDVENRVAENDPVAFVKVDRWKRKISLSFWVLLVFVIVLICSMVSLETLEIREHIPMLNTLLIWFALVLFDIYLYTVMFTGISLLKSKSFFRLRARARFQVFYDSLFIGKQKERSEHVSLFREAVNLCNVYLRRGFDIVIRKPERFYNYIKVMTCMGGDSKTKEIKKGLRKLIRILKEEESAPFEVISALKEAVGERVSDPKDIMFELEVEPRLKKWFLANLQVIIAIVEIVSLLIVIFGYIVRR